MPILLTDIQVPVVERKRDYSSDYLCSLCETVVGTDYHFQPEPHTLDECIKQKFESIERKISTLRGVVPR